MRRLYLNIITIIVLIIILFSYGQKVNAQGSVYCANIGIQNECLYNSNYTIDHGNGPGPIQCDANYKPPCNIPDCDACKFYAGVHNASCPFSIPCIPQGVTTTPVPPPAGQTPPPVLNSACRQGLGYDKGGCNNDQDCTTRLGANYICDTNNPLYSGLGCAGVCADKSTGKPYTAAAPSDLCQYVTDKTQNGYCTACKGTWTALGCIETDQGIFFKKLLGLGMGIAGGIAFLLILFGGFQILISAGNPEQMNAGKEMITSAIAGLLLIVFSVFLLRLIGYNILGIPGFG